MFQALEAVRRFSYRHDFGDSWEHEIIVEDIWRTELAAQVRSLHRRPERLPTRGRGG
jgi:hypothetical protein